MNYRIKELKEDYPEMEIILRFEYEPNSINLYNQMKETMNIKYNGNHFKTYISQVELIYGIIKLHIEKK